MSEIFQRQARAAALPEQAVGLGIQLSWSRLLKIGGAVSVLAIGAYAVVSDQVAIATDNAVVSAYAVALRTPIDGVIGASTLRIGDRVARGDLLTEVSNNRVDDQRLVDLREHLTEAHAHLVGLAKEQNSLEALRKDLDARTQAYVSASEARLTGSVLEAQNALASLYTRRGEAKKALERRSTLAQGGYTSASDLDKAQSDFEVASHDAEAQRGRLDALLAQAAAISNGVVTEPGSNDVAYSRQRADEIVIRLSELAQQRALTLADIDETTARLASEQARIDKLQKAPMIAPTSGMIWKLEASTGERVGVGQAIAQIVDCGSQFIIATVPQSRVPNIELGSEVEYRLSGDATKRNGHIASVTGDTTGGDRNLAALPFEEKGQFATVRIAIDSSEGECFVGRTARVIMPSRGPGLLSRLFNRLT